MNILERTLSTVHDGYGPVVANKLAMQTRRYNLPSKLTGLSEVDQIKEMNSFWDSVLSPLAGTTEVRSWLEQDTTIDSYISNFRHHWLKGVMESGFLN